MCSLFCQFDTDTLKYFASIPTTDAPLRARLVLLRGGRVWPEDTADGSAYFYRAADLNTSGNSLYLRIRESAGVRTYATPRGPCRFVALPPGELS